jgi:hypothetical protein
VTAVPGDPTGPDALASAWEEMPVVLAAVAGPDGRIVALDEEGRLVAARGSGRATTEC